MTQNPFEQLGKKMSAELGDEPERGVAGDARERAALIHRMADDRRRRRRNLTVVSGSLAVLLAAGAATWMLWSGSSPELLLERSEGGAIAVGAWIHTRDAPLLLRGNEGTELTLDVGSRARIAHLSQKRVQIALEAGRIRASVQHKKGRRWIFVAGPYQVEVVGTKLSLDWTAANGRLTVGVTEGAVRVHGNHLGDKGMLVRGGQKLRARLDRRSVDIGPIDSKPIATATAKSGDKKTSVAIDGGSARVDSSAHDAPPTKTTRPKLPRLSMRWRALARAGNYKAAARAARKAGLASLCAQLDRKNLMVLADAGRLGADWSLAERGYLALRKRFAKSRQARLSAFRLGRLYYEQRRDYRRAASWFGRYVKQSPKGVLAADALGRQLKAFEQAGMLVQARRAAKRYLARYPRGAYAASARAIINR
jgi:transmembrane sensor